MAIVHYRWTTPPKQMTDEERAARLAELENEPEPEIDFSDIPEFTDEQLAQFVPHNEAIAAYKARKAENKELATVSS